MGKALIIVIVVVFSVYSLFDVLAQSRTRSLSKPVWALLALVPLLGPLGWLALGRPPATRPGRGGGGSQLPRITGPDDDPDFLWNLDRRKRTNGSDEDPPQPES